MNFDKEFEKRTKRFNEAFDKTEKRINKGFKLAIVLNIIFGLLTLALTGGIVYIILHFIFKFW